MYTANTLKINDAISPDHRPLIQAINRRNFKPLKIRKFVFLENKNANAVPKREFVYFQKVRLVQGKRMYVEYYFRIPRDLTEKLPASLIKKEWVDATGRLNQWARFRVFENINKIKDPDYPQVLLQGVKDALSNREQPLDPFQELIREYNRIKVEEQAVQQAQVQIVTVASAMEKFLKNYPKGTDTWKSHCVTKSILIEGLQDRFDGSIASLTTTDLREMLNLMYEAKEWTKSTFNDKVGKLKTFFEFCKETGILPVNTAELLKKKPKVGKSRHMYYDKEMGEKVVTLLLKHPSAFGKQTHEFCQVIYYTCTRPDKETRALRCKDILWDRHQIYIPADRAKGGAAGYIDMVPELETMLRAMKIDTMPGEWFLFGSEGKPGPVCHRESYLSEFFRKEIREPNGISEEYTLYGWKHTRITHLFQDGASIQEIMHQCRHTTPSETEKYLYKDLGLKPRVDTNKKTREF
jgi:integrase